MQEIKFRGISINTKEIIYSMTISNGTIKRKADCVYFEVNVDQWVGVDPESVSQYVNLKDCKGNDVYENDVLINVNNGNKYNVFRVSGGFAINTHQNDFNRKTPFYTALADMQTSSYISGNCVVDTNSLNK